MVYAIILVVSTFILPFIFLNYKSKFGSLFVVIFFQILLNAIALNLFSNLNNKRILPISEETVVTWFIALFFISVIVSFIAWYRKPKKVKEEEQKEALRVEEFRRKQLQEYQEQQRLKQEELNSFKTILYSLKVNNEYMQKELINIVISNFSRDHFKRHIYSLSFPYWKYAKVSEFISERVEEKGHTHKARRINPVTGRYNTIEVKDNHIICGISTVNFAGWQVNFENVKACIIFVKYLRSSGYYVPLCKEELLKKELLSKTKGFASVDDIINQFKGNPTDFEKLVAEIYESKGYSTFVTSRSNDGGYDVKIEKDGEVGLIECKLWKYTTKVGRPELQKLKGANSTINADRLIFVTTSGFSPSGIEYANESDIELVDGNKLLSMLCEMESVSVIGNSDNLVLKQDSTGTYLDEWVYKNNESIEDWKNPKFWLTEDDLKDYVPKDILNKYL